MVTAAVHLGILSLDQVPGPAQLLGLDYFDRMEQEDHGRFHIMGRDAAGNQVYVMGMEGFKDVLLAAFPGFARIYGIDFEDFMFVDTLSHVNLRMRLGGFLSRALGLVAVGRPLVISGTRQAFPALARLGLKTRDRCQGQLPAGSACRPQEP